jgi:hypothetical protein
MRLSLIAIVALALCTLSPVGNANAQSEQPAETQQQSEPPRLPGIIVMPPRSAPQSPPQFIPNNGANPATCPATDKTLELIG